VLGDDAYEIQMSFIDDEPAREFALAHARVPAESDADALTLVSADGAGSDDVPPMTLREMCDAGIVPRKYSAAKRARTRAGETFPRGERTSGGILHDPSEVKAFFGNASN
jgi:hypothetical protein